MTSKAFAFLNDLGFNYSLCSHVVFSDSSCLHPVNELSGSNNPVEAFLSVHWVAGLGHLCQKLMALICTREDGCPVQSLGRIHGASLAIFSLPLLLFMAFFFLSLCFNPYLSKSCFFFFFLPLSYLETDLLRFAQKLSLVWWIVLEVTQGVSLFPIRSGGRAASGSQGGGWLWVTAAATLERVTIHRFISMCIKSD